MLDLQTLVMDNFRSYVGEHTFEFPKEPGLYGLFGLNLDKPRLGPNGTGKSTMLDAVYWVLYGATTRGLRGTDVISWGQKTCSVKLTLNVGGQVSTVYRRQAPNDLKLDGRPCEQEAITKYIRLAPEAFLHAVMFPQFGDSFFDMSAGAKLNLFSEILKLDYWLDRAFAGER